MIRQFTPTKDASVYSEFPTRNTGIDEILEFGKSESGIHSVRSILGFDFAAAKQDMPADARYILRLHTALAARLVQGQQIAVGAYTGSWTDGTGYFYQDMYQLPSGIVWSQISGSQSNVTTFTAPSPWTDLQLDVTSLISGSSNLSGLIIQFPDADEANLRNTGNVRVFSSNTHTIYAPILEVRWADQVYDTGSLAAIGGRDIQLVPHSLRAKYSPSELVRVGFTVREKYPLKTFSNYLNPFALGFHLPATSYFSIIDEATNHPVIPFSEYSTIHQTSSGSYCTFRTDNMFPRRFYRMVMKIVDANGDVQIFDNNHIFSIR